MRYSAKIIGLCVLVTAGQVQAADSICPRLDEFVRQQMAETSKPAPRHFVEFHWGQDGDAIFSKGCRHSEDTGSAKFCHWLLDNTSWEFRARLPISILQCFGYGFPKDPAGDWAVYDGQFSHEYSKGNWLKMELASKGLPGTETALRLYVDSINRNFAPDELDPVTHMASADDGGVK